MCNLTPWLIFVIYQVSAQNSVSTSRYHDPYNNIITSSKLLSFDRLSLVPQAAIVTSTSTPASILIIICLTTSVGALRLSRVTCQHLHLSNSHRPKRTGHLLDQPLMNSHLIRIPRFTSLTTRRLPRRDFETPSRQPHRAFNT